MHSRSQYPIQEAHEETTKSVLVSIATITGCVDLHGRCISWRLCIALHIGKVKPVVDFFKVFIIQLVHICFEKSSSTFWQVRYCVHRTWHSCQKCDEDFFQILWPSQKTQTLILCRKSMRLEKDFGSIVNTQTWLEWLVNVEKSLLDTVFPTGYGRCSKLNAIIWIGKFISWLCYDVNFSN